MQKCNGYKSFHGKTKLEVWLFLFLFWSLGRRRLFRLSKLSYNSVVSRFESKKIVWVRVPGNRRLILKLWSNSYRSQPEDKVRNFLSLLVEVASPYVADFQGEVNFPIIINSNCALCWNKFWRSELQLLLSRFDSYTNGRLNCFIFHSYFWRTNWT